MSKPIGMLNYVGVRPGRMLDGGWHDPLDIFVGKAPLIVDPLPVLMQLLKVDPIQRIMEVGSWEGNWNWTCVFCGQEDSGHVNFVHAGDCPYFEAITLFGDPNSKNPPLGILNP